MIENYQPVVIDNGSGLIKIGLSGENRPYETLANVIGKSKYQVQNINNNLLDFNGYQCDEIYTTKYPIFLNYPLEHGIIDDWDVMDRILNYCFYKELKVKLLQQQQNLKKAPEDQPLLLSECPYNPKSVREKTINLMFETFQIPSFSLINTSALSLYGSGKTNGLIVDCGHAISSSVPVFEGYALRNCIQHNRVAGNDVTKTLNQMMSQELGIYFSSNPNQQKKVEEIKEKFCYISQDYEDELRLYNCSSAGFDYKQYKFPDGQEITLKDQTFRATEILFNPRLIGRCEYGIQEITYKSLEKCDIDLLQEFYKNIILVGGSSLYQGFQERLQNEIQQLSRAGINIKVQAENEREFQAWIGGSVISSLSSFQGRSISKNEYEEEGENVVHRKCL